MFDSLSIFVADMATSLAFYRRLGLDIPADADGAPHAEHLLPSGFRLMWDTHETVASYDPAFQPSSGQPSSDGPSSGGMELAWRLEASGDVDALHASMTETGHASHLAPFDAPWGQRYAIVVDPDGHHVAIFAPLTAA